MATRSRIAILNENGTYSSVYCHWDGAPDYNGRILVDFYTNEEIVKFLINQGDLSSLEARVHKCAHYHRRNPIKEPLKILHSRRLEDVILQAKLEGSEFLYLFKDGEWFCSSMGLGEEFLPVEDVLTY